jgi:hypothetical protein
MDYCNKDLNIKREWMTDCCLTPNQQFFSHIIARTSYIRWDDDGECFVLDQHA